MKNLKTLKLIVAIGFIVTAFQTQAQVTVAWTGTNGNLVGTSAAGGVSYGSYQGGGILLQGGVQNSMDGSFGNPISIPEVAALESFSVYPNPTNGVVFVDIPATETVQVFSIQGQLVQTSNGGNLDITELPSGMYLVLSPGYEPTRIIKQ